MVGLTPEIAHPLEPFGQDVALGPVRLEARVKRTPKGLSLAYLVEAGERIRLADASALPARRDRLWESTCFEAFVAPAGSRAYWEVNLAPSGDWNLYRFSSYREGMVREERVGSLAAFHVSKEAGGVFRLLAEIDLSPLAELATRDLDLGLTAVLESLAGEKSYWALRHTERQPDFHSRATFIVALAAPQNDEAVS